MILFDMLMKAPDSYWKRQYRAGEIRRKAAEADAKCYRDQADYNYESLGVESERSLKQARAIDAYIREIGKLNEAIEALQKTIADKDKEIGLLHEALRTERDLTAALKMNGKLWENLKQPKVIAHSDGSLEVVK